MKIINLMEDTMGEQGVYAEHGLCIYAKTKNHQILVDTGASEKTWENAKKHNVDLSTIDSVFLSHGHYDHSGGILSFAEYNPNAKIYIHACGGDDYYNIKDGKEKYIGIDKRILDLPQVVFLKNEFRLDREIRVFSGVTARRKWPKSNLTLKRKVEDNYVQDSFEHEQYIVLELNNKGDGIRGKVNTVLISGCAHNGILNILDFFKVRYGHEPDIVISGFHMMKRTEYEKEEIALIQDVAEELKGYNTLFYTGHCTGMEAFKRMKNIMGENLVYMHSGDILLNE